MCLHNGPYKVYTRTIIYIINYFQVKFLDVYIIHSTIYIIQLYELLMYILIS